MISRGGLPPKHHLTPAEIARLRPLKRRTGDDYPMYADFADGHRETIPWLVALNLDVPNIPTE